MIITMTTTFYIFFLFQILLDSQKAQFEETLEYLKDDKKKLNLECERLRGELEKSIEKVSETERENRVGLIPLDYFVLILTLACRETL